MDCVLLEFMDKGLMLRFTIRGNGVEELKAKVDALMTLYSVKPKEVDPTDSWKQEANKENDAKAIQGALGFCKDCGGAKIMGKNGKPYCKPCYIKWAEANKK